MGYKMVIHSVKQLEYAMSPTQVASNRKLLDVPAIECQFYLEPVSSTMMYGFDD